MSAVLKYGDDRMAVVSTHSEVLMPNNAMIVGTRGHIQLESFFHCCQRVTVNGQSHDFSRAEGPGQYHFGGSSGLKYEAHEVRRVILAGRTESEVMPHRDSVMIARISDEIRRQLGVHFE